MFDTRCEDPHLADGNALFPVHPDRVFIGIHRRLESDLVDCLPYAIPDCIVDNLVDVRRLQLRERFADDIADLSILLNSAVEGILMQPAASRVSLLVDWFPVGIQLYPAANP